MKNSKRPWGTFAKTLVVGAALSLSANTVVPVANASPSFNIQNSPNTQFAELSEQSSDALSLTLGDLVPNLPPPMRDFSLAGTFGGAVAALAAVVGIVLGSGQGSSSNKTPDGNGNPPLPPDEKPDWEPSKPIEDRMVPSEKTIVAPPGATLNVDGIGTTSKIVLIDPSLMEVPEIGDILVVNVTESTPVGVVGRVLEVNIHPSGLVAVSTEQVSLEEAFDEFSFDRTISLSDAILYDAGGPVQDWQALSRSPKAFRIDEANSLWKCEDENDSAIPESPVTVGIDVTIEADAQFDLKDRFFNIDLTAATEAYMEVMKSIAFECNLAEDLMPSAWIPLYGPLGIEIGPKITTEGETSGSLKFSTGVESTVSVVIDGDQSKSDFSFGNSNDRNGADFKDSDFARNELEAEASLEASVKAQAKIGVDMEIAKAQFALGAGPVLGVNASATWTEEPSSGELVRTFQACISGEASGEIEAELESKFLDSDWNVDIGSTSTASISIMHEWCFPSDESEGDDTEGNGTIPNPPLVPDDEFFTRPGQLTNLKLLKQLATQIDSIEDGRSVYFGDYWAGTNVYVDNQSFGTGADWSGDTEMEFEPISGPTVSGTGTDSDPFVFHTKVRAGKTGIELDQIDVFEDGNDRYITRITVTNTTNSSKDLILYRGADCYLNKNDFGSGLVYDQAAACVADDGRRISLNDATGGATAGAGLYKNIWKTIEYGQMFSNTAEPGHYDNGMGLSWSLRLAPGESKAFTSSFKLEESA